MKPPIIIANNFWHYDEPGGAHKIATDLAAYLYGKGYSVHYICMAGQNDRSNNSVEYGVNVWRYARPRESGRGGRLSNFFRHLRRSGEAAKLICKNIPRGCRVIVNGHTGLQYLGALNALPRSIVSRKVLSVHSPMAEEYIAERSGGAWTIRDFLASRLLHNTESRCYSKSDSIQCDSEFTRSLLDKKFANEVSGRMVVCPGYVDTTAYAYSNEPKHLIRSRLKHSAWQTEATSFFCLRRHVRRMGIDNLIRAAAWLREKMNGQMEFRVIIGGDGPLKSEFQELASELKLENNVFFLGNIPELEVASHYQAADCFVLPTRSLECFGLIILEAFSCGTPVIATPVGSIPEVLGPFAAESLTGGSESHRIGGAMMDFMLTPRKDGQKLRRYAELFNKDKILSRLEKIVVGNGESAP